MEMSPTEDNRASLNKFEADLKRYLHIEEEFWRQKDGMKWFSDKERTTKLLCVCERDKKEDIGE